jgi:hypothetical protein
MAKILVKRRARRADSMDGMWGAILQLQAARFSFTLKLSITVYQHRNGVVSADQPRRDELP